jgi:hypothetical protein
MTDITYNWFQVWTNLLITVKKLIRNIACINFVSKVSISKVLISIVIESIWKLVTSSTYIYSTWRHDTQHNDIQHNDTQHKGIISDIQQNDTHLNNALTLCWVSHFIYYYAECRYAECSRAFRHVSKRLDIKNTLAYRRKKARTALAFENMKW